MLIIIANIIINSFCLYSSDEQDYASEGLETKYLKENLYDNETKAIKKVAEKEKYFYRFSGRKLIPNANMISKLSSTQYYWTISNPYTEKYRKEIELNESMAYQYQGYDARTIPNILASVKYYVVPEDNITSIPYGFKYLETINVKDEYLENIKENIKKELNKKELTDEEVRIITTKNAKNYKVYKNKNHLPLTYSYDNYITLEDWKKLPAVEKQEKLLYSAVLEKESKYIDKKDIKSNVKSVNYDVKCNQDGITMKDNKFIVTKENLTITLNFEGIERAETYISIKGLDYKTISKYDFYKNNKKIDSSVLYNKTMWNELNVSEKISMIKEKIFGNYNKNQTTLTFTSKKTKNNINYYTKDYSFYNGRHDFTVNLGYSWKPQNYITINFPEIGVYSFEDIKVKIQPINDIKEQVKELKQNRLKKIKISKDKVTGEIELKNPKVLVFSIPYAKGWKAKVNGVETKLLNVNSGYMGLDLNKGKYKIELKYKTPYKRIGTIVSLVTLIGIIIYVIIYEKNIKIENDKSKKANT